MWPQRRRSRRPSVAIACCPHRPGLTTVEKMKAAVRHLHLLRHAKSSWADEELSDHDRPLSGRGRRACNLLAGHLASSGIAPDLVLASPARRAAETVEGISGAFRPHIPIWTDERLYTAEAADLAAVIAEVPDMARSVLLVGHNPAIEDLAEQLIDDHSSEAAIALRHKYPTGALASFEVRAPWTALTNGGTRLRSFVRPRDLRGSAGVLRGPSPS